MSVVIRTAQSAGDYAAFGALVSDYVVWCRSRYAHDAWFIDQVFGHQDLAHELQQLQQTYGPPNGLTLLARRDDEICGGGAYHRLADGTCEMKRLFVPDRYRGLGIGRALGTALIESARAAGFPLMRLDTGNLLAEAIAMYRKMDFRDCEPHRSYPAKLLPYLVFMELPLQSRN
jgi:GNAT superfamily N-acetyltransferase